MIRKVATRASKLLAYGMIGVVGYSVINKNPYEQFKKPEIQQVISREPYRVQLLLHLPLNSLSRVWGRMSRIEVPSFLRAFVYTTYIKAYNCDVAEAENEDLRSYKCFGDFFGRSLKPEVRPISQTSPIVSPTDGVVLSLGRVDVCQVSHVKDKDYSLQYFIGPKTWDISDDDDDDNNNNNTNNNNNNTNSKTYTIKMNHGDNNDSDYNSGLFHRFYGMFNGLFSLQTPDKSSISHQPGTVSLKSPPSVQIPCDSYLESLKTDQFNHLYHCTVYLAPGDYHRFHSPADWKCTFRRHFPGYLLSVSPKMADRIPELMNVNERVVYVGRWRHGFMGLVLVGATNVGSIRVYNDPTLVTNTSVNLPSMIDTYFSEDSAKSVSPSSSSPTPLPQIAPPNHPKQPSKGKLDPPPPPSPESPSSESPSSESPSSESPSPPSFLRKMTLKKGDPFGQFDLGSTIVLLFEAPRDFKFSPNIGDQLKYGQSLGTVPDLV